MTQPFIGEIKLFGFNFAPQNYAFCNGALQSIAQNTALFSILGTTYGGDGQTTFGLPDLRGRTPVHQGQGTGLSPYVEGQFTGVENVTLLSSQIPSHTHNFIGSTGDATQRTVQGGTFSNDKVDDVDFLVSANASGSIYITLNAGSVGPAGGSQSHSNIQPYLVANYCIALYGVFPTRS